VRQGAVRVCGIVGVVLVAVASVRAEGVVATDSGVALTGRAGLGGIVRPGRWAPVRVVIDNDGTSRTGELILQWGESTVRRDVALAGATHATLEIYIRSTEPQGTVRVRLVSQGATVAAVDLPVRVQPPNANLTVCIMPDDGVADSDPACTVGMAGSALPRSMRGYDAADAVISRDDGLSIASEQHAALDGWRAYRLLDESTALSRAPRARVRSFDEPIPRSFARIATAAAGYVALLGGVGLAARRFRRMACTYAALVGVTLTSTAAMAFAGRLGAWSSVLVRHVTTVQQFAGGALVSMRGVIEYPAFDSFAVGAAIPDGVIDVRATRESEQRFNDSGYPVVVGTFGLGHRESFTLEGILHDFTPIEIVRAGREVRVSNRSATDLHDCRFPDGYSVRDVGDLPPGRTVDAQEVAEIDLPFFTCSLSGAPFAFFESRAEVRAEGTALLSAYLSDADAPNVVGAVGR
jgi:hypothetical protein